MKATELRIGNLVLIPSHSDKSKPLIPCVEKRVKGITMFGKLDFTELYYPELHLVHYNHCAGIPLTEEWLLKFGFEKDITFTKRRIDIWYSSYNDGFIFRYGHDSQVYIASVHQLQNLYFALTGEELKYES